MAKQKVEFGVAYGEFPSFEGISLDDEKFQSTYLAALSWCAAAFSPEELKAFLIEYLEKGDEVTAYLDLVPPYYFQSIGKIAYICMQGVSISPSSYDFYCRSLATVRQIASKMHAEAIVREKCGPASRSQWHDILFVANTLEDMIDNNRLLTTSDGYELLVKHKQRQNLLKFLQDKFKAALNEYLAARTEFVEYFETVSDDEIKYRIRCYSQILEDIESVTHNKKAARSKAGRRPSIEKKIKNVSYCQVDTELKIQSMDPSVIIGSQTLVLYNRKSHRITVLVAIDGFTVKGTSVHGFDPLKSVTKTLRNPERQVLEFRRADRTRRIDVLMEGIKGKVFASSGRLNADTLIIKCFTA